MADVPVYKSGMKLALCIITIGDTELDYLKSAVESTKNVFDGVFITANGKEVSKTKKWCEKNGYHYSNLYWNDSFAEQRNFNFAQVPDGYDYICWMDSDDVIINPEKLKDIARIGKQGGFEILFFDYWYGSRFNGKPSLETFEEVEVTQSRERLIKPGSVVWKKRLHETPVPTDDRQKYSNIKYSDKFPVVWLHLGINDPSPEGMKDRTLRNRKLLELDLKDERTTGSVDPRTILYLMKVYAEEDDLKILKECISLGEEYMAKSGWDEERAICCKLMSVCYGKLGQHTKARRLLHEAIEEFPYDPLLYLYLARVYFSLKNYSAMKHWLEIGLAVKDDRGVIKNIVELKTLSARLMFQYYFYGDKKNALKAWQSARVLAKVDPQPEHKQNEKHLFNIKELELASKSAHKLMLYYKDIDKTDLIPPLIESLPKEMSKLPFAQHFYNKYKEPRIWGANEICYFANFGQEHFEKWSPMNLKTGIGGSETAVIRLSQELTKMGWKMTIYGDPGQFEGEHDGVTYLPYYKFNSRDKFNIFIQWRQGALAGRISAKKFLVDLHDLFAESSIKDKPIDKVMVKSKFHASLAPSMTNLEVISNGI